MRKACACVSKTCCRRTSLAVRRGISIQCYTLFRVWLRIGQRLDRTPIAQLERNPNHLADYFGVLRMPQDPYLYGRKRMRLQYEVKIGRASCRERGTS